MAAGAPRRRRGRDQRPASKLRRVLGPGVVDGRSSLRLRLPPDTDVDVETAVAERELLPGESAPWIDEHRLRIQDVRLRALEAHAAAAYGTGGTELPAAVRAGRRLILLALLRETGYQILMRALARQGNVAEALGVYSRLRDILRDALGVSLSAETQAVYEHLLHE